MKSWWLPALGILVGIGLGFLAFRKIAVAPTVNNGNVVANSTNAVADFSECLSGGYPVVESYPRRCSTPEGRTFTEDIGNALAKADLITVSSPKPNDVVASPLVVTGQARGTWFFEAEFRVQLLDTAGTEIAASSATAMGEWMTTAFVPFTVSLTFPKLSAANGTLVLRKANPSGLASNDDQLTVPVRF